MNKRFGIDIDGTVTCPASIIPFINESFNMKLTLEDIHQYDLNPFVNVPEDEFAEWFFENEPAIYTCSPMAEGAEAVLKKWKKNHELIFISARDMHLLEITKQWFIKYGLDYDHIELIGTHDKVDTAKKHKVDVFLEDKHDNAVTINEQLGIPVLLFDTPYNQEPIPDGVIRVKNWSEANEWIEHWLKTQ